MEIQLGLRETEEFGLSKENSPGNEWGQVEHAETVT